MARVTPPEGPGAGAASRYWSPSPPSPPAPPQAPPGWYRDPSGAHSLRYWNGWGWTPGVSDGAAVAEDRVPSRGGSGGPPAGSDADQRASLPRRAALLAAGGIVAGLVLGIIGSVAAQLVVPHAQVTNLILSQLGLWAGLVGAVAMASHRYGSGNVWRDFGVRFQGRDPWRGVLISIAGRVAGLVAVTPLLVLSRKFEGSDLGAFQSARGDPAFFAVVAVIALIGAPFAEELFFRGLLLRSLVPLLGTAGAITGQALIFGMLHLRPSYGLGNVSVFVAIAAMGVVQGIVAERYRRLGPGMVSHGFFNLVAVVALWPH